MNILTLEVKYWGENQAGITDSFIVFIKGSVGKVSSFVRPDLLII
jgi:hypothetical protein